MSQRLLLLIVQVAFSMALLDLAGCASFMEQLKNAGGNRDVEDVYNDDRAPPPAVSGGIWPERGILDESSRMRPSSNSMGRAPASLTRQQSGPLGPQAGDQRLGDEEVEFSTINPKYKNGVRATRNDFIDESQNEGSLWASDGQTNYYFTKNKVRDLGDILNISIEDPLVKDVGLELKSTLNENEQSTELALAQERLRLKALGLPDPTDPNAKDKGAAKAPPAPPKVAADGTTPEEPKVDIPKATLADIDVHRNMNLKAGETMMAEVLERYPNGNYKVRGVKRMNYLGANRLVYFVGIARSKDIDENDTIPSGKFYEYRIKIARN